MPTGVYAQFELYQLAPGEYSIGVGFRFPEDMTGLDGSLNYSISNSVVGSLSAGILFADKDSDFANVSTPPMKAFSVGVITSGKLGRTELDYWATTRFGLVFEELVSDITDETIMTSRDMALSASVGLMKGIEMSSGIVLVPLAGVSNTQTWIATELDTRDLTETESENTWHGQIGLIARLSPAINVGGKIVFSFEESDLSYHLALVLRP
jgi:hypothetical protein